MVSVTTLGTHRGGLLALVADPALRADVDRIAAAAGVRVVHAGEPSGAKTWAAASAVVLDATGVAACAGQDLPRRAGVYLVVGTGAAPDAGVWRDAIAVGVQRVVELPSGDAAFVADLSATATAEPGAGGPVVAVLGGRGGAGASVFAAALALTAPGPALLVDADPWSGGLDLVLGCEAVDGVRWPDLTLQGGRVSYPALRDALPSRQGVAVLSAGRAARDVDARALATVLDAGSRGGATVVCDVPRQPTAVVRTAIEAADLVVVVTCADVRSAAATAALGGWLGSENANVGVVVRGPAPGGLRAVDVAALAALPLLASMRPQPQLAQLLERGGLTMRARSPLAHAAHRVHALLHGKPADASVAAA